MAINSPEHGFTRLYMFNKNLPRHSSRKVILRVTLLVRDEMHFMTKIVPCLTFLNGWHIYHVKNL